MKVFVNFIFLIIATNLHGINLYFKGDTLFVWSKTGLILRESGSFEGKKLQTIPFGKHVITKEIKYYRSEDEISSILINSFKRYDKHLNREIIVPAVTIKGRWVKVVYQNQEGYLFDGYLSKFPPIFNFQIKYSEFINQYLNDIFKILNKKEINYDGAIERHFELGSGVSYHNIGVGGGSAINYYIPKLSYDEIIILLLYSNYISENEEYENNKAYSCKNSYSRSIEFEYCCALKTITVIEVGQMTIIQFSAAC